MNFQTNDGRILRLGEVAEVKEDHQPLIGDAVIDDGPGLLLIVEKLPWANTLEVTRGVDQALEDMKPGLSGIEVDAEIFRPATFIEMSIDNLTKALIIASLLVILVLGLFLFEWRTALISVVAIPLSLISAALVLYFLGVTMNTMVLAGFVIALGDVVDDAIIDVENIVRRLRQYRREGTNKSTATIILEASLEVRNAIVFATLIIVVALSPILFMEGLSGAFFKPLALSYVLAMLASMVVALTVPEETRITVQASKELRSIPGVRNFGAHIGQALIMDEVVGVYFGENWVSVDPAVDYDQTLAAIQEAVDGYPGVVCDVQTYLKERIREVLTGSSEAIVIRIYGQDLGVLRSKAEEVRQGLEGIEGIVDLHVELQQEIPQIEIEVDLAAAEKYGIKPGDVRRAAVLVSGQEAGDIFRDGKAYDVQVWSTPETRDSLIDIRQLLIDTPTGGHVRLEEVADVRIAPTPNVIERENRSRRIDVEANVQGRDLGSVVSDVERAIQGVEFPLEYRPELLGEFAERQAAQQRIQNFAVIAVIVIFFLLQLSFGSWRLATMAFVTLPLALVGGVLAAFIGGGVISLGSLVGFLTVLGIAARNGIMMINHFQHLEEEEGEPFGPGLVLRGARERLAPILMTAGATALALLPLVAAGDIPGQEIEYPIAIVILGGLGTSTLLNLFVVPSLYLRFAKSRGASGGYQKVNTV